MISYIILKDRREMLVRLITGTLSPEEMAEALEYHLIHKSVRKAKPKAIKKLEAERDRWRSLANELQTDLNTTKAQKGHIKRQMDALLLLVPGLADAAKKEAV